MRKRGYWIIWTVYFDLTKSRGLGRKLPKGLCVKSPSIEELVKAIQKLGLEFEVYPEKKHPAVWFEGPYGCIAVRKVEGLKKRDLLKMIAKELVKMRRGEDGSA